MSPLPNTLKIRESVLDDFPREPQAAPTPSPVAQPLTFLEEFDLELPGRLSSMPAQAARRGTSTTRPRRRRGLFVAAAFGVAAGAIGGLVLFAPVPADRLMSLQALLPAAMPQPRQPVPPAADARVEPPPNVASAAPVTPPSRSAAPAVAAVLPKKPPAAAPAVSKPIAVVPSSAPPAAPLSARVPRVEPPASVAAAAAPVAAPPPAPVSLSAEPAPASLDAPSLVAAPNRIDVGRAAAAAPAATAAAASPAPAVPAAVEPPNQAAAIDAVLDRYQAAYGNRDAAAVKRLWPSANQAALAKAFANLESQNLAFYSCKTTIEGSTARASCGGQMSYVARVGSGSSRTQHRDWTFTLSRNATDNWQIDGVVIR